MNAQEIIKHHGGCARLAQKLGLENPKGTRRVYRWELRNAIPPKWVLKHPKLFRHYVMPENKS